MCGVYTSTPLMPVRRGQKEGRWKEFIVAAGSRCIWNVTAFRMLWMFYEKTEEYASLYFIANCCISQCRHDCLTL
jgi:hypothetical protein